MTTVVYLESVLTPHLRRVESRHGSIQVLAPDWQIPYVAFLDGKPVLRADWELVPEDNQSLAFIEISALPQGGGGGGSDALRVVLIIAVMVMAPQIGVLMGPGMFGAGVMGLSAATWSAAVSMVGVALVNALIPPPKPTTPQQQAALAAPSPTYNLQAQGNMGRLDSAIPEHFGRMVAYPDFAAKPYSEYSGNEQYVYELLCVGRGYYDIEAYRIEDTPMDNFDDITREVIPPGGSVTLFPTNVISSSQVAGQELVCFGATYNQPASTVVTVTKTAHGLANGSSIYLETTTGTLPSGDYTVVSVPTADTFTVSAASATTSGGVTVSSWFGGFMASASGQNANYLGLDVVAAKGLFYANDDGSLSPTSAYVSFEARTVDAVGTPTSGWVSLTAGSVYTAWSSWTYQFGTGPGASASTALTQYTDTIQEGDSAHYNIRTRILTTGTVISGATTTPQRVSWRYPVTLGRYEVRGRRTTIASTSSRVGHAVMWGGLRAYMPDTNVYGDVTLIALRMRASNNLSSRASTKVNVIATRKLPIWNGSSWSALTATRSPAMAFAYACKQAGLSDAQIDLAGLLALEAITTGRSDYFDGRFDNFLGYWEALSKIAGSVRAKPFMQGGVMRVVRDQASSIPVAMFSVRNIVKGSFGVTYLMPTAETADVVDVKYFDSTSWSQASVRADLLTPSARAALILAGTSPKPAKIDLFGVTSRAQAYREGLYQAASNRYRRKIIKFKTEMEGFIPSLGDLIAIQHDMPAWGQSGELVADNSQLNVNLIPNSYAPQLWSPYVEGTGTATIQVVADPVYGSVVRITKTAGATGDRVGLSNSFSGLSGNSYTTSIYCKTNVAGSTGSSTYVDAQKVGGGLVTTTTPISGTVGLWARVSSAGSGPLAGATQFYVLLSGPIGSSIDVTMPQLELSSAATTYCRTPVTGLATTNLLTNSQEFDLWADNGGLPVTANAMVAPDGTMTADTTTVGHSRYTSVYGLLAGDVLTYSFYVKPTDPSATILLYIDAADTSYATVYPSTGVVGTLAGGANSAGVIGVGAGWYRVWMTYTTPASGEQVLYISPQSDDLHGWWGAQLEAGGAATPYIRTTSAAATGYVYTTSEPLTWQAGSNHYIGLRKRDGSVDGPYLVTSSADAHNVVFSAPPSSTPDFGGDRERTHYMFGWGTTWQQPARLLSAKPSGQYTVDIEAVGEDSNVHTADTGVTTPALVTTQLSGYTNAPIITGLAAHPVPFSQTKMSVSWDPAQWADHYYVEQSLDSGLTWTRMGDVQTNNFIIEIQRVSTKVRVAALGIAKGSWTELDIVIPPPPAFDTFLVSAQPDGTRQYNFGYSNLNTQPFNWKGAEIRYIAGIVPSPDWNLMTPLQDSTTFYTSSPIELNAPLSGTYTFAARSTDLLNQSSSLSVRSISLPDRRLGNVFDEFYEMAEGWLGTLTGCHIQDGILEANDTTTWATLPATWAAWTRWNTSPTSPFSYVTPVRDFLTVVAGQFNPTVDADGTILLEIATSADGSTWSAWGSASAPFSTRYFKARLTVTATVPFPIPVIRDFRYLINAPIKSEYINDKVISTLTGSYRIGVGDIRIPLVNTYTFIKRTSVVVQDNSAGTWTYVRIDQTLTYGPRWQFRLNGVLADPQFVDFFIEGF